MTEDSVIEWDNVYDEDNEDKPLQKKHGSNMTFKERVGDWFCRMMERCLAPGSYYLSRRVFNSFSMFMQENPCGFRLMDERMSKVFIMLNKKNKDFGNDIVIVIYIGHAFVKSIRFLRFLGLKFNFFKKKFVVV